MASTLEGLRARGHQVTLVAPAADDAPVPEPRAAGWLRPIRVVTHARSLGAGWLGGVVTGEAAAIHRHRNAAVTAAVRAQVSATTFDVLHVQQLHALVHAEPCLGRVPVVVRAENVEHRLWAAASAWATWLRPLLRAEARRMAAWEASAVERATTTAALTLRDARVLADGASNRRVCVVRAPMPAELSHADNPLDGDPALVLVGSRWMPNRDGADWFVREAWPRLVTALPGARLHVFGAVSVPRGAQGVVHHGAPEDARSMFAPNAIVIAPSRIASGTSMRVLEALARGVPVVAHAAVVEGLEVSDECPVGVASDAAGFAHAVREVAGDDLLRAARVAAGRRFLHERHDPLTLAGELERVYLDAAGPRS